MTFCDRCGCDTAAIRAWSGFVWVKRGWYLGVIVIGCLSPILFSEITLLLPMACAFGLAGGPVHALAAQGATCSDCGGPVK